VKAGARVGLTALALGVVTSGDWADAQGRSRSGTPVAAFYGLKGNDWPWVPSKAKDERRIALEAFRGDPATLRRVRITHRWHLAWFAELENIHPSFEFDPRAIGVNPLNGQPWGYDFPAWMFCKTESGMLLNFCGLPTVRVGQPREVILGPFDGVLDFAGKSGETLTMPWDRDIQPEYWTTRTSEFVHPAYLAPFTDPDGVVDLRWHSIAYAQVEAPWGEATLRNKFIAQWDFEILAVEYVTGP
jgi:hypothetical protein